MSPQSTISCVLNTRNWDRKFTQIRRRSWLDMIPHDGKNYPITWSQWERNACAIKNNLDNGERRSCVNVTSSGAVRNRKWRRFVRALRAARVRNDFDFFNIYYIIKMLISYFIHFLRLISRRLRKSHFSKHLLTLIAVSIVDRYS